MENDADTLAEPPVPDSSGIAPAWCVIANVVTYRPFGELPEDDDAEMGRKRGTRLFNGGAKLYVLGPFSGDGGERMRVIGLSRGGGRGRRLITAVMPRKWLVNWRVQLVYSPAVHRAMGEASFGRFRNHFDGSEESRAALEEHIGIHAWWARHERESNAGWVRGGFTEGGADPDPAS